MTEACSVDVCGARGAAQELAVARVAEQQGDIPHAAFHVAAALFADPLSLEAQTMALRLDDAQPGVFQPDGFAGTFAAAVVVAMARGKLEQALSWTAQLAEALPDLPWQVWLAEQVSRAVATNTPIPVDVARLCIVLGKHTIGVLHLRPGEQRAFARYADALFGAAAAVNADGFLCGGLSALCRRAGQYERAVALAQRAHAVSPTESLPLIMLGLSLRAAGRTDDAADAFRRASDVDGGDGYRTERARCFVDAQRFQEALDLLEQVAEKDSDLEVRLLRATCVQHGARLPRVARAKPGLLQRFLKRHDDANTSDGAAQATEAALLELAGQIAFAGPHIDSDGVRRLALGHGRWFGVGEATVNLLRQVPRGKGLRSLTLSALEAPSSQLALALHSGEALRDLNVSVQSIPTPDPRSVDDDALALWTFAEHAPSPAVPAPPAHVLDEIVAIASSTEPVWWPALLQRATTMRAINVDAVLACMVHPGLPPADVDVVMHVVCTQFAAAAVLSRIEAGRAALLRLLGGPIDWVTVAAATALVEACCDGVVEPDVLGPRLGRLVERIPEDGHCCLTEPLRLLLPRVPFLRSDVLARLEALNSDDNDNDDDNGDAAGEVV